MQKPKELTPSLLSPAEIQSRRSKERSRKRMNRATRAVLAAAGVSTIIVTGSLASNRDTHRAEREKARAALLKKATPTPNSSVVVEPYTIGSSPLDTMLSKVADELHPLANNQDQSEEVQVLRSYLTAGQEENSYSFTPGRTVDVTINTESGEILPKSYDINSADQRS